MTGENEMRKVTKLLMILALAGPSVINMSCSSMFTRQLRDAAFAGVANFVQGTAFDALNGLGG
jgi:hypothetical protein